jgi:hypothetical protein
MRNLTALALAGTLYALITPLTLTGAGVARDTVVTTTLSDAFDGSEFRVHSDFRGPYVNTKQIQSVIQGQTGDWILTTYSGVNYTPSNRTVFFDLSEPVDPTTTAPFTVGFLQSHLIAKCHMVNQDLFKLAKGVSVQCPGSFRFQVQDGRWFRLSFQPANFPEVNYLKVTCNAVDAAGCKLWNISPSGTVLTGTDPNPKNVNRLVQIDPRSEAIIGEVGDFYVSFAITVAR